MGRMEISSSENADTQLKLDKQTTTLDEVRSDIDQLKENLKREQAQVQSRTQTERKDFDKAISALAITSTIFTLVVSGTLAASVHDIATQAADLSRLLGSQINKGKRTSSDLTLTGPRGAHSDMELNENGTPPPTIRAGPSGAHGEVRLNGDNTTDVPTDSEHKLHFVSSSPKRGRQNQDGTISAEEDLGLLEKAWKSSARLCRKREFAPTNSNGHYSIGLSCFLRQLPPIALGFLVKFETQDQCDRGHYFRWRNHCLRRIECPDIDLSFYESKSALVSIAHLDLFDQLRAQISPSRTESAADLFCDWVIMKLDGKDRPSQYVITVATDEYHIAKSGPGLRISCVEHDNTSQHDHQLLSDTKESTRSGLIQDLPSLLATTIVSLPACFALRSYPRDSCSCPSIFVPRNWPAYNEDLQGCMYL